MWVTYFSNIKEVVLFDKIIKESLFKKKKKIKKVVLFKKKIKKICITLSAYILAHRSIQYLKPISSK